jgi:hypothetical protein
MNLLAFLQGIGGPEALILTVLFIALYCWPFCLIFKKAGYPFIMGITMLVPLLNIVMLFFLAFARWPIEERLQQAELKRRGPESF